MPSNFQVSDWSCKGPLRGRNSLVDLNVVIDASRRRKPWRLRLRRSLSWTLQRTWTASQFRRRLRQTCRKIQRKGGRNLEAGALVRVPRIVEDFQWRKDVELGRELDFTGPFKWTTLRTQTKIGRLSLIWMEIPVFITRWLQCKPIGFSKCTNQKYFSFSIWKDVKRFTKTYW